MANSFIGGFTGSFTFQTCPYRFNSPRFGPTRTMSAASPYSGHLWCNLWIILPAGKANDYYVARLLVRDLTTLGLRVIPEPNPQGPPGHSVISELSWQNYNANRQRYKPILAELAKLASADIVLRPP